MKKCDKCGAGHSFYACTDTECPAGGHRVAKQDDDMVTVRIGLPLPMDITGTLLKVIGKTWPGAVIKGDGDRRRTCRQLVVGIPNGQRHRTAKKAKKYAKRKEYLNATIDADVTELGPDGVTFSWPEWLAANWVVMARECWKRFPDAKNYLQSEIYDKETKQRYVFYVAKSDGQTPHALRQAAENRLQAVRAICDKRAMDDWLRDELLTAVDDQQKEEDQ